MRTTDPRRIEVDKGEEVAAVPIAEEGDDEVHEGGLTEGASSSRPWRRLWRGDALPWRQEAEEKEKTGKGGSLGHRGRLVGGCCA